MKYRPEIDGLRALAVIPVILFHAGFELFSGGFVGVDVFFVISGYLITTILLEDIENKQFSIVNFYEKRARRILPALYLVLSLTFLVSLFIWSPSDVKNVSQSLVATALFANNVFLTMEGHDYFGALNNVFGINPLLHTWSLAVEEQFYIVFPIILFLLSYFRFKQLIIISTIITICIFFYALINYNKNEQFVFYATHFRAWQLLTGAVCAILAYSKDERLNGTMASFMPPLGLILIAVSAFEIASIDKFGYIFFLLPTLGSALIIYYSNTNNIVNKLLSNKILVAIGLISYGLYLWHQPIFSFLTYRLVDVANPNHGLTFGNSLLAIALTIFLSIFSYFYC
ncbi:acyltransferase [Amylibacter sp.]|nr:acyltransferase [Amylibacter sp.]